MPDTTSRSPIHKAVWAREGQKSISLFFVLFYCTNVCYRPLGSVNSSTRVPELAKPSLPGLGQPPATLSSSICVLEFTFPFLADHSPPRFCKFEHASARIGKTDHSHSWPTTHHLGSANSSTQMLELAKLSVPALGWPPTTSVPALGQPSTHLPPWFCKFEHAGARIGKTKHSCSWLTTPRLDSANSSMQVLELAKPSLPTLVWPPPHLGSANSSSCMLKLAKLSLSTLGQPPPSQFCQFKHTSAWIGKIEPVLAQAPLVFANSSAQVLELAKSSLSCLLDCPPPSFLPIWALVLVRLNWQNWAHLVPTLVHTLSPSFCGFQHLYARIHGTVSLDFS